MTQCASAIVGDQAIFRQVRAWPTITSLPCPRCKIYWFWNVNVLQVIYRLFCKLHICEWLLANLAYRLYIWCLLYIVPDYRRWWVWVNDGILYPVKHRAGDRGITAENMENSQHTDFNEDTTNESASVACSNIRLWKLHGLPERMKKHVLTPSRWKDWERFCGFRGQQRKQMSGFLTKLE